MGDAGDAGETAIRHGRLARHRLGGELLRLAGIALAVLLVSAGGIVGFAVFDTLREVSTNAVDIGGPGLAQPPAAAPGLGAIEGGFTMLIVGTDNDASQGLEFGERDATLNDVNLLLRVSADHEHAVAISLPRDLVIPHPECVNAATGETFGATMAEPLNASYERGGLACVVSTIAQLTGLEIGYAGVVSFNGVIALSDAVGGVPVCLADPISDPAAGLELPAGESVISGSTALAFLRARYGVGDGSDLARISTQQSFLSSLLRTVRSNETLTDPVKLYSLARVAADHMTLSTSLASPATMISLALSLKGIPLQNVVFVQYPAVDSLDFAGKVEPDQVLAAQMMALVQADQLFTLPADAAGAGVSAQAPAPPAEAPVGETPATEAPATAAPPVLEGLRGQNAADQTCAKAFSE